MELNFFVLSILVVVHLGSDLSSTCSRSASSLGGLRKNDGSRAPKHFKACFSVSSGSVLPCHVSLGFFFQFSLRFSKVSLSSRTNFFVLWLPIHRIERSHSDVISACPQTRTLKKCASHLTARHCLLYTVRKLILEHRSHMKCHRSSRSCTTRNCLVACSPVSTASWCDQPSHCLITVFGSVQALV